MYGLPLLPEICFPQPLCIASGEQSIIHRCLLEAATSQRGAVSYSLFLLRRNRANHLKWQTMQPRRLFTQKLEAPWRSALEELHPGESWQKTHPVSTREAGAKLICSVKDRRVERTCYLKNYLVVTTETASPSTEGETFSNTHPFNSSLVHSHFSRLTRCSWALVIVSSHLILRWTKTMLCRVGVHSSPSDLTIWVP